MCSCICTYTRYRYRYTYRHGYGYRIEIDIEIDWQVMASPSEVAIESGYCWDCWEYAKMHVKSGFGITRTTRICPELGPTLLAREYVAVSSNWGSLLRVSL